MRRPKVKRGSKSRKRVKRLGGKNHQNKHRGMRGNRAGDAPEGYEWDVNQKGNKSGLIRKKLRHFELKRLKKVSGAKKLNFNKK